MALPSFKERISIAIGIVTQKYPKAQLYEVDGIASNEPTDDPSKIDQLRIIFRNTRNSTIIIKSTGWDTFSEPVYIPHPWCNEITINWPLKMDLNDANNLKEKAGYKSPYKIVALKNPLAPEFENPHFIFGTNNSEPYIFVDTITEKVFSGN